MLAPHAAAWDALVEETGGPVWNSFDWCRTWWQFYGRARRLLVVLVWDRGELVAVWRLFRETLFHGGAPARLVRLVGCDFGTAVGAPTIAPGMEDEAARALSAALSADALGEWDAICLGPFRGYGRRGVELAAALGRRFGGAEVTLDGDAGQYVVFDLPATYDGFLAGLGKNRRYEMLRQEKLLSKEHRVEHVVRVAKDEVAEILPDFFESHERLWRAKGMRGYFNEWPDAKAFHVGLVERLSPEGRSFITELLVDAAPVTRQYCFRFGRLVHWFQPTREESSEWRKRGVGNIGFLKLVQHSIAAGAKLLDAGGRPIDYKLALGGRLESSTLITLRRRGWSPALRLGLFRLGAWILHTVYARLWCRRLAPMLRATGGAYSRTWVRSRVKFASGAAAAGPSDFGERRTSGAD